jgi:Flp pilus assembly pilin Flp
MVRVVLLARRVVRLLPEQRGQTLIEYGLLTFLIAIAAIAFLTAIGFDLEEVFNEVEDSLGLDTGEAPTATGDDDQPTP